MRKRSWVAVAAALGATLAIGAPAAISAGPGQTVNVKSTVTLGASGYQGKVTATVVLKQKGNGVLSRVESNAKGSWKADLEDLNANIEIPAMVYAEVKPSTQATAGPIYKCAPAVSRTVEIAGG